MKIKVLEFVNRNETGMLTDLKAGDIVLVDDSVGEALIEAGKAEFEF